MRARVRPFRAGLAPPLFLWLLTLAGLAVAAPGPSSEAAFLAQNDAAMTKMHAEMMGVQPTGDVDVDFVNMMVPHHQGAVDMARAVLRYGHNEQIRRIAQEIVVDQQQEIVAMRLAVGQPLPPSSPAPTQAGPAQGSPMPMANNGPGAMP